MPELADVNRFIELSRKARSLDGLNLILDSITHEMGFDYYALVQHVDIRRSNSTDTIWLENYPKSWAEAFVAHGLYASDPIHVASQSTNVGFLWSDVSTIIKMSAHHRRVLEQAQREGLGDGFTVPAHLPGVSIGVQKGTPIGVEEGPPFLGYDFCLLMIALRCVRRRAGVARPEAHAAQERFLKVPKVAVSCGF